jgi:hypothetical protein
MLHVDNRPSAAAPVVQQLQHAIFGLGVIAPTQPGVKDAFLLIDDEQCGVFLQMHTDSFQAIGFEDQKIAAFGSPYKAAIGRQILK